MINAHTSLQSDLAKLQKTNTQLGSTRRIKADKEMAIFPWAETQAMEELWENRQALFVLVSLLLPAHSNSRQTFNILQAWMFVELFFSLKWCHYRQRGRSQLICGLNTNWLYNCDDLFHLFHQTSPKNTLPSLLISTYTDTIVSLIKLCRCTACPLSLQPFCGRTRRGRVESVSSRGWFWGSGKYSIDTELLAFHCL